MISIKTFRVKHKTDFGDMFEKAYQVALFAQSQRGIRTPTSKDVKQIGLKSAISNQILRKYHTDKKLKSIKKDKIKLIIPNQGLDLNKTTKQLRIIPLKLTLIPWFDLTNIIKINQIELDKEFAYISCTFNDEIIQESTKYIGIDLNSTSHSIVLANQSTGNVKKYGKSIPHIQKKYKEIRRKLQSKNLFSSSIKHKNKANRIVKDKLHKITTAITKEAKETGCGIKLENLKGISKKNTKKHHKNNNFTLNSWPFYEFRRMIEYKAKLLGVSVLLIAPQWTSQTCYKCKTKGERDRKLFRCLNINCKHIDHADVNAAFNIAFSIPEVNSVKNDKQGKSLD